MADPIKLSIVIVNWNGGQYLLDCLDSIYCHPPECAFDVWLVDNASTDGSAARASIQFPQIQPILNQDNPGFASANNQAIRASSSQYLLLLNPDTVVQPGALRTLVEFLDANPSAGGCGPRLTNPDGSLQISCFPSPTIFRELWRLLHLDAIYPFGVYPLSRWRQDAAHAVDAIQGACLLIRRSALNQVGELDPGYFMYTEEIDLCHRLRTAGWSLFWLPWVSVVHFGGKSTEQAAEEMFLNLYRSKVRFFRVRYGEDKATSYKHILAFVSHLRLALVPLLPFASEERRMPYQVLASRYRSLLKVLPGL